MEEFKYTPLDLEKPGIRLFCLHSGSSIRGDVISGKLIQVELHERTDMISYEALSYTWGSPCDPAINPIICGHLIHMKGGYLRITRNLYNALLDLRHPENERLLWIDAVCIDQGNNRERGHQVGQMGNIYKQAAGVIFRLGRGSYMTDLFLESLERLQTESNKHVCRAWSRQDSRWEGLWTRSHRPDLKQHGADLTKLRQGLQEILEQPWFRRVWILQEVAFAKAAIISCGKESVSARLFGLTPLLLGITPDAHCQSVLDIMPSPWRESTWWSESRSFYKLLFAFGGSEATDPRDLVYALRGMSSDLADKSDDSLFPDYMKLEETLVQDVVQYIYGSVDLEYSYIKEVLQYTYTSIPELVKNFPRVEADICMYLAETSQPYHMERILKMSKVPVSQDLIKAATKHDKVGEVVKVLLRCRGGEFKIDDEILLCAAANLDGAEQVFEALWSYENQLIITEQILVATAENPKSGHLAIRFLLSLKTQDFDITTVLVAVSRNPSKYIRREIIEILLWHKTQDFDITTVLAAVSKNLSENVSIEIIEILLQHKTQDFDITPVLAAVSKNTSKYISIKIIEILLQHKTQDFDITPVLAAVSKNTSKYDSREIIEILLQQKGNSDDTISEILTVAAGIKDCGHLLLGNFVRENPEFEVSRDAVIAAMGYLQDDRNSFRADVLCHRFPYLYEYLNRYM
ncbi:heterokaryon incompatibility protein domain-containing protein [Trichoderma camerunense]